MKILHLRATNFYGGPERQLHEHALAARGSDAKICVSSFAENGRQPDLLTKAAGDGIPVHLFKVRSAYDLKAIGMVRDYLKEMDIDILCSHDYRTALVGYWARKGTRARWIAFSRGWTKENLKIRAYCLLDKFVLRFADRIVAVSSGQKQKLVKLHIDQGKISVVHNAVRPEEFDKVPQVDLRRRFNLPAEAIVCISGGRFSAEKGQDYLIKAAAQAIKRNDKLRFILFGDGPDIDRVKRLAVKKNCDQHIVCPGFEQNLIGCIKGADLLVNPSLSEGLPNIVLEALALKIPVVATSVGGVPEVITDGHTGILVPPKDVDVLTNAIVHLSNDDQERKTLAHQGFDFVKSEFTFEKQSKELTRIYREVLNTSRSSDD